MKQKILLALGMGLMTTALSSNAAVITFNASSSGTSYTEAGMTITATSAEPVRTDGARWFLDCCDAGRAERGRSSPSLPETPMRRCASTQRSPFRRANRRAAANC